MPEYRVKWDIDIEADSPREAAKEALSIQRDPGSEAVVFEVVDTDSGEIFTIDLLEEGGDE